jgi:hypothetical protein
MKRKHYFEGFVSIILTFSLSHFHKDYLTTNFNLTTEITLMIKKESLGVLDTTLCDKVCR